MLDAVLLIILTATIVISIQAVGIILILALLVTPAATARLLVDRFVPMMLLGGLIGMVAGVAGYYLSFYLGWASGGTIVLLATCLFLVAFVASPSHGLFAHRRRIIRSTARRGQQWMPMSPGKAESAKLWSEPTPRQRTCPVGEPQPAARVYCAVCALCYQTDRRKAASRVSYALCLSTIRCGSSSVGRAAAFQASKPVRCATASDDPSVAG